MGEDWRVGLPLNDRFSAWYHRVHEPEGDGWDVICSEHGRIAGGPGALSLDKLEALNLSRAHEATCPLIAAQRAAHAHEYDVPSFTCPRCHRISYHPDDVAAGYCGACHDWTREPPP
jgi:hypothetical protein